MAKYNVLRDCFCTDRFFYGGHVMELPDGLDKLYPKNFQLIEEIGQITHPISLSKEPSKTMTVSEVAVSTPFFRDSTEGSNLDYDNAEVYISDKPPKAKAKSGKSGKRGK